MSDLVGNPEDRFSQNEALCFLLSRQGVQRRLTRPVIVVIFFLFLKMCFALLLLHVARFPLHSCHLMFKTMNKIKTKNNLQFLCLYIPNNISSLHMCNEISTNLWAVFTISACPTPCWFDSRQKSLPKDRGNYKLQKYGKPC